MFWDFGIFEDFLSKPCHFCAEKNNTVHTSSFSRSLFLELMVPAAQPKTIAFASLLAWKHFLSDKPPSFNMWMKETLSVTFHGMCKKRKGGKSQCNDVYSFHKCILALSYSYPPPCIISKLFSFSFHHVSVIPGGGEHCIGLFVCYWKTIKYDCKKISLQPRQSLHEAE